MRYATVLFAISLVCSAVTHAGEPEPGAIARIGAMAAKLTDPKLEVRLEALKSLQGDDALAEVTAPYVVPLLRHRDERLAAASEALLIKLGAKAIPALAAAVKAPRPDYFLGGGVSGNTNPPAPLPDDVPVLVELLKDKQATTRLRAMHKLYRLGPKAREAVPALSAMISTSKGFLLAGAIRTLGGIGPDAMDAVPLIVPHLSAQNVADANDELAKASSKSIALTAAYALVRIDSGNQAIPQAAAIILARLQEADHTGTDARHEEAIEALKQIGAKAVPVLIDACKFGVRH